MSVGFVSLHCVPVSVVLILHFSALLGVLIHVSCHKVVKEPHLEDLLTLHF